MTIPRRSRYVRSGTAEGEAGEWREKEEAPIVSCQFFQRVSKTSSGVFWEYPPGEDWGCTCQKQILGYSEEMSEILPGVDE